MRGWDHNHNQYPSVDVTMKARRSVYNLNQEEIQLAIDDHLDVVHILIEDMNDFLFVFLM